MVKKVQWIIKESKEVKKKTTKIENILASYKYNEIATFSLKMKNYKK